MPMEFRVPPDLEALVEKRLKSGAYESVEDVFRSALEAQDEEEGWTEKERRTISEQIERGYAEAERGDLVSADQVRRDLQAFKEEWLKTRK